MGDRGSEVAKEASDVILVDDNFASIVRGIERGRVLFDNLKKTIAYTLTHLLPVWLLTETRGEIGHAQDAEGRLKIGCPNTRRHSPPHTFCHTVIHPPCTSQEILPVLLTIMVGLPPGLTTLQILSIDLATELAPAISLAYEPAEKDIMKRPPRNMEHDRLVSPNLLSYSYLFMGVIESIACLLACEYLGRSQGGEGQDGGHVGNSGAFIRLIFPPLPAFAHLTQTSGCIIETASRSTTLLLRRTHLQTMKKSFVATAAATAPTSRKRLRSRPVLRGTSRSS